MAFSLPSDLPTNVVDDVTTADAAFYNNMSAMGNALKAALGTWGYNPAKSITTTSEATSSTSYTDLTTTTDQVTVPIGSSGMALVFITSSFTPAASNPCNLLVSYSMSGANTVSATDTKAIQYAEQINTVYGATSLQAVFLETGLTAGFTTFKMKYRASAAVSSTFSNRRITVIPFPSTDGTHASGAINLDISSSLGMAMSGSGYAVPTYDAVGTGSALHTLITSTTWTHTATAGSTVFGFVQSSNATPNATLSMTYGSRQMARYALYSGTNGNTFIFVLFNAPGGQQTVTLATGGTGSYITGNTVSYLGIKHINYGYISNLGTSTSPSLSAVKAGSSGLLLNVLGSYRYSIDTVSGGGNTRWNSGVNSGYSALVVSDSNAAYTLSGTMGTSSEWAGVGILVPTSDYTGNVITRDAIAHGPSTTGSSISWSHTAGSGATIAVVWVTVYIAGITSITFGGQAMTLAGAVDVGTIAGGMVRHHCYYLMNPPTGSQTVAVNIGSGRPLFGTSITYNNVGGVGAAFYTSTGNGTTISNNSPMIPHRYYTNAVTVAQSTNGSSLSGYTQNQLNQDYVDARVTTSVGDSDYNPGGFANFGGTTDVARDWASSTLGLVPLDTYPYSAALNLSLTPSLSFTAKGAQPTFQGANASHAETVTIPTHAAGDIIVIFAKASVNAAPTKPAASGNVPAWVDIDSVSGSYTGTYTAYFVATGSTHTSGTWTGASAMVAAVLRGQNTSTPIGGHGYSAASATGNTCPGAAITLTNSSGSSQILEFYGYGDNVNTVTSISAAPTGHTRKVDGTWAGSQGEMVALNTKDDTTSDGAVAQPAASGTWTRGASVEILSQVQ